MQQYRVMNRGLRFRQKPGGPKIEVRRPQNATRTAYTDSDEAPTLWSSS